MSDAPADPPASQRPESGPPDTVQVLGPDERVACIQLAARWAEHERSQSTDTSEDHAVMLTRFRQVHAYLDAVVHGVEPPQLQL